jgi:hypothetical protein
MSNDSLSDKFSLLVDLGTITVPKNYNHATQLATFSTKNRHKFQYYDDNITDEHFSNPSRVLKPGDTLRVRAFQQIVSGATTTEERLAFLATQQAVFTGAQGLSHVFEQKRDQLPKDKWCASLDEKEHLWEDADGDHRVPCVNTYSGGDFDFDLGYFFGDVWNDGYAFFCFCDA